MENLDKVANEESEPRRLEERETLLKKYDIPISHLEFDYVAQCTDGKKLERILQILQSGEEGYFPQLTQKTEERLTVIKPTSRYIRKVTPVVDFKSLDNESKLDISEELTTWIDVVSKQNEELDKHKESNVNLHDMPEVRQKVETLPDDEGNGVNKVKRIKATDYASWDKYDPDTEILKMDLKTEKLKNSLVQENAEMAKKHSVKFNEFLTKTEATNAADREREKGNEYYKTGDYQQAITCYSSSINFLPSAANFNNRAQAHIKIHKYAEAVDDCKAALKYDETNVKANVRMAESLSQLKQHQEALFYAEKTISLDPNNTIAQNLVNKISTQMELPVAPRTRMKIVEITEETSPKPEVKTCQKSILKKSGQQSHVLLPIPGPSTMPEPYYVIVENKDPEIIRRQEFVLNNKPQLMYLTNIDMDEDDCLEFHNLSRITRTDLLQENYQRIKNKDNKENLVSMETKASNNSGNLKGLIDITNDTQNRGDFICTQAQQNSIMDKENNNKNEIPDSVGEETIAAMEALKINEIVDEIQKNAEIIDFAIPSTSKATYDEILKNRNDGRFDIRKFDNIPGQQYDSDLSDTEDPSAGGALSRPVVDVAQHLANEENNSADQVNINGAQEAQQSGGSGEPHLPDDMPVPDINIPYLFLRAWKTAQRDRTYLEHARILRSLNMQRFREVIGFKLDGSMLTDILRTLYLHFMVPHEVDRVYGLLTNVARLPRFNIVAMCLLPADREKTRNIFEFLEQHGVSLPPQVKERYL